jgi:hypothetical protein
MNGSRSTIRLLDVTTSQQVLGLIKWSAGLPRISSFEPWIQPEYRSIAAIDPFTDQSVIHLRLSALAVDKA